MTEEVKTTITIKKAPVVNVVDDTAAEKAAAFAALDAAIPDAAIEQEANKTKQVIEQKFIPTARSVETLSVGLCVVPMGLDFAKAPNAAAVWNGKARHDVASKLIPVLNKYPLGQKIIAYLDKDTGVEFLDLAMVLFPLGQATYAAYQFDIEVAKKAVTDTEKKPAENLQFSMAQGLE